MSCDYTMDINALSSDEIRRRSKWLLERNKWLSESSNECIKAAFYNNIINGLNQKLLRKDAFIEFISKSKTERIVETEWVKMMVEHANKYTRPPAFVLKDDITPMIPEMPVIHIPVQRNYIGSDINA